MKIVGFVAFLAAAAASQAATPEGIPGAFVGTVNGVEVRMPADLYVYTPNAEVGKITVIRNTAPRALITDGMVNAAGALTLRCVWPKEGAYKETELNYASIQAGQGTDLRCVARFGNGGPFPPLNGPNAFPMTFVAD